MATLAQMKHLENKQHRKKKYVLRHRRIISLMNRYANGSLTLDEYFIKISKTIGKRNASSDINIDSAENLPKIFLYFTIFVCLIEVHFHFLMLFKKASFHYLYTYVLFQ